MPGTLLLLSIDGLRPSDCLDAQAAPHLARLAREGCAAEGVEPIYPSVTIACHATMVTGVYPDRHGVSSNTRFDPRTVSDWIGGEPRTWQFESSAIRSPTLWDALKAQGKRTALLRWPLTVGAPADWLVPEVFSQDDRTPEGDWRLLRESMDPVLLEELAALLPRGLSIPRSHFDYDDWMSACAAHLIRRHRPDALFVHLSCLDHETHEYGTRSTETRGALSRSDDCLGRILAALDPERDRAIVCGDHGFLDFDRRFHANALLAANGWLRTDGRRIQDWQAVAHTSCGQAAVYLRDVAQGPELSQLLRRHAPGRYVVLDRRALDGLRALPGAFCAIDCLPGYSMGQGLQGAWDAPIPRTRGEHGHLPTHPGLQAAFIAWGRGIGAGMNLGRFHLCDLAPTFASLAGLRFPGAEGRAIPLPAA